MIMSHNTYRKNTTILGDAKGIHIQFKMHHKKYVREENACLNRECEDE